MSMSTRDQSFSQSTPHLSSSDSPKSEIFSGSSNLDDPDFQSEDSEEEDQKFMNHYNRLTKIYSNSPMDSIKPVGEPEV